MFSSPILTAAIGSDCPRSGGVARHEIRAAINSVPIDDSGCIGVQLIGVACGEVGSCPGSDEGTHLHCVLQTGGDAFFTGLLTGDELAMIVREAVKSCR